jgi:hypothetical protein
LAPVELVRAFLEQASATGNRSTVLQPLNWLMCLLAAGMLSSAYIEKCPPWIPVLFGVGLSLCVVVFICGFVFFSYTNPDALRSERFTLSKIARV